MKELKKLVKFPFKKSLSINTKIISLQEKVFFKSEKNVVSQKKKKILILNFLSNGFVFNWEKRKKEKF